MKENDSIKPERLSLLRLLPNIFTTIGMCSGLTGIRYALESDWKLAVVFIFIASFFDLIDGLTARVLNASTQFGAELDSLADAISFGVTPSIILFLWLKDDEINMANTYLLGWYWIPFLLYSSCCVLRLARFNVDTKIYPPNRQSIDYFLGVPAPAAAFLALLPIVFQFTLDRFGVDILITNYPFVICMWVMIISILMVSRIPTISPKNMKVTISRSKALFLMITTILIVAIFIKEMWLFFTIFSCLYFLSIPFGFRFFKKT